MVSLSTHILDTSRGLPANEVHVKLYRQTNCICEEKWELICEGRTNSDGRFSCGEVQTSPTRIFKFTFEVNSHFHGIDEPFYPVIDLTFRVATGESKYHVPLLLNPFGYSTYRGS